MVTSDLPIEIWLEILLYLSDNDRLKTIGINRALFETVLDGIYKEISLLPDDKATKKVISQLQCRNISQRVQILVINPAFLNPAEYLERSGTAPRVYRSLMKPLKKMIHRTREAGPLDIANDLDALLLAAKRAITTCTNLREIAITSDFDHTLTGTFLDFFNYMWSTKSFGRNLKKLTVKETFMNIPRILKAIIPNARDLENLKEVNLTFAETYLGFQNKLYRRLQKSIEQFVELLKPKGTKFTFYVEAEVYHDRICTTAPALPYLDNLSLSFDVYDVLDVDNFAVACKFINEQVSSVRKLAIHGTSQLINTTSFFGEGSCARFVLERGPDRFHTLRLPCLEDLHIDLPPLPFVADRQPISAKDSPFLSSLATVAPTLKSIRLNTRNHINPEDFTTTLVDGLPQSLESLELSCPVLTATLFDSLSSKMPSLRRLTIHTDPYAKIAGVLSRDMPAFPEIMQSRRYSSWGLQSLRITQICLNSSSQGAHPDTSTMAMLSACFPENMVQLDKRYYCGCKGFSCSTP